MNQRVAAGEQLAFTVTATSGGVQLALANHALADGVTVTRLELTVDGEATNAASEGTEVSPASVSFAALQRRRASLTSLSLRIDADALLARAQLALQAAAALGVASINTRVVDGRLDVQVRLSDSATGAVVTFSVFAVTDSHRVRIVAGKIRAYGVLAIPAPTIVHQLLVGAVAAGAAASSGHDGATIRQFCDVEVDIPATIAWAVLPARGWRVPNLDGVAVTYVRADQDGVSIECRRVDRSGASGSSSKISIVVADLDTANTIVLAHAALNVADEQFRAGRFDDALRSYRAMMGAVGVDQLTLCSRMLAILSTRPAWFAEGLDIAREAFARWPDLVDARLALGAIALAQGDHAQAAHEYGRAARAALQSGETSAVAPAAMVAARLLAVIDPPASTPLFELAHQAAPDDELIARALSARHADEQRVRVHSEAATIAPGVRAHAEELSAKAAHAITASERAVAEGAAADAWLVVGDAATALHHAARAIAALDPSIDAGTRRSLLATLGEAAWRSQSLGHLVLAYTALMVDPVTAADHSMPFVTYRLASALARTDDPHGALSTLATGWADEVEVWSAPNRAATVATPTRDWLPLAIEAVHLFASLHEAQHQLGHAARAYEAASRYFLVGDDLAGAIGELHRAAELWRRIPQLDDAIRCFETALKLQPSHAASLGALEQVHRSRGDLEPFAALLGRAIAAAASAPTKDPQHQRELLYRLANVWHELGRHDVAVATHRRILELDADDRVALAYIASHARNRAPTDSSQLRRAAPPAERNNNDTAPVPLHISEHLATERIPSATIPAPFGHGPLPATPAELATAARRRGALTEAYRHLLAAEKAKPNDVDLRRDLVDVANEMRDYTSAAMHLRELARQFAALDRTVRYAETLLELADLLYDRMSDRPAARAAMMAAADAFPNVARRDSTIRLVAAEASAQREWHPAAEAHAAIPPERRTSTDWAQYATVLYRMGLHDQAREQLALADAANQSSPEADALRAVLDSERAATVAPVAPAARISHIPPSDVDDAWTREESAAMISAPVPHSDDSELRQLIGAAVGAFARPDRDEAAQFAKRAAERLMHLITESRSESRDDSSAVHVDSISALESLFGDLDDVEAQTQMIGLLISIASTGEARAELWRRRAQLYRNVPGHAADRYRSLQEAHAASPVDLEIIQELGELAIAQGDWALAAALLYREIAATKAPRDRAALHHQLALIYDDRLVDAEAARSNLDQAVALDPSLIAALSRRAEHYERAGDFDAAATMFRNAARAADGSRRIELLERASISHARKLADVAPNANSTAEEERTYVAAIADASHDGDSTRAWAAAQALWALRPGHATAFGILSEDARRRSDVRALAKLVAGRVGVLDDADARASLWSELGERWLADGSFAEAARAYDRALIDNSELAAAIEARAELAMHLDDWATADVLYARVDAKTSTISPTQLLRRRAELAERLGRSQEASDLSNQATAHADVGLPAVHEVASGVDERVTIAAAHQRAGNVDRARRQFERIVADDPEHSVALGHLVEIHAAAGAWPLATRYLRTLVAGADTPELKVERLVQLGVIYADRQGDLASADDVFMRAADLAPDNVAIMRRLLDAHWRAGDVEAMVETGSELARAGELFHADVEPLTLARAAIAFASQAALRTARTVLAKLDLAAPAMLADALSELLEPPSDFDLPAAIAALTEMLDGTEISLADLRLAIERLPDDLKRPILAAVEAG